MTGIITKGISGFYYVLAEGNIYECKARGVFRKKGITPMAGDDAVIEFGSDGSVTVTEILPRRNQFGRPPVANVEVMVIVTAARDPAPALSVLDRFTVTAEETGTEIILCINKADLAAEEELDELRAVYAPIYPVYTVSAKLETGINELKDALKGRRAAFAGPSGSGKSSLTNLMLGREESRIGEISRKLMRGKNTTRHSQLFIGNGFEIFDTPGFTSFDAVTVPEEDLDRRFPEFRPYLGSCRFDDCRHLKEPGCAVRKALEAGLISRSRYHSYTELYKLMKEQKKY